MCPTPLEMQKPMIYFRLPVSSVGKKISTLPIMPVHDEPGSCISARRFEVVDTSGNTFVQTRYAASTQLFPPDALFKQIWSCSSAISLVTL